uniref:Adhesion G protein-coupled receptor D2 n=1 Tax=Junco hyemalis TaxID=40217 RepID=A0A8C5II54_JUNHY
MDSFCFPRLCVCLPPGFAPVTIETPRHTYEYVGTALDWWQAGRYCEQHFAQLLLEPQDSEQGSLSTLLQSHHIRGSVWLKERDSVLHKTKRRRGHTVPVLVFRDKTDTKYVRVLCDFPALAAVTACAHLQWDTRSQDIATVFSYAVPAFINEFQLRGFVDEEGFVRFALIVHGHHSPYLPVFRADGQWHHFCVTWQQDNGTWAIYADGKRRAAASGLCSVGPTAPQAISGQGTFIIGQDQDSLGGTFRAKESFSGNITDLHIWHKVLSTEHIERARSCWVVEQDLLFGWSSNALEVESTVQTVATQLLCPGESRDPRGSECPAQNICCARACRTGNACWGWRVPGRPFCLCVFPQGLGVQDLNLSVALDALDVLAAVLREEVPVLEPSDLLAVLQLLKQVSDLEIQEGDELEMLEQLGQYYMEVTELILEEQNSGTWSLISQGHFPVFSLVLLHVSPDAGGMWSTAGCSVAKSLPDSTACFCNHTTNFAILLQVYEMEQRTTKEEFTLQTLTFIGCGVSFCALVVTFILFLAVGVPKSERTTVHKNLILALAAGEALLMVSELAKPSQVLCFMVTAFLHLFFMAAFSWMLVEGLLLWSKVVAVNMSEGRRMRFYYVTGWGLPVLIVGVTLASSFDKYVAANHCWLNVQTNVIWAFVGPVLLILAVSAKPAGNGDSLGAAPEKQATAKPVLVLLPVLGLTWLCGLLVHLSIVWAYVFIVLNSLQVSPASHGCPGHQGTARLAPAGHSACPCSPEASPAFPRHWAICLGKLISSLQDTKYISGDLAWPSAPVSGSVLLLPQVSSSDLVFCASFSHISVVANWQLQTH